MIRVYLKEVHSFFDSLIAYLVIAVFLTGIGLLTWVFPDTSVLNYGYADMATLFSLGPFVLMFLIPAVTMKTFSEEKKNGTIELLFTKPISDWQIILGKYFSVVTVMVIAIIPTLLYYWSVYQLGNPVGNIDTSGVIGSYIGLIGLGSVFCAVGIVSSSITKNQIVAFVLAVFACFILFSGLNSVAQMEGLASYAHIIGQLGIYAHYESMSRGLIDSRDVVYFASVIAMMLLFTKTILGSRKW